MNKFAVKKKLSGFDKLNAFIKNEIDEQGIDAAVSILFCDDVLRIFGFTSSKIIGQVRNMYPQINKRYKNESIRVNQAVSELAASGGQKGINTKHKYTSAYYEREIKSRDCKLQRQGEQSKLGIK